MHTQPDTRPGLFPESDIYLFTAAQQPVPIRPQPQVCDSVSFDFCPTVLYDGGQIQACQLACVNRVQQTGTSSYTCQQRARVSRSMAGAAAGSDMIMHEAMNVQRIPALSVRTCVAHTCACHAWLCYMQLCGQVNKPCPTRHCQCAGQLCVAAHGQGDQQGGRGRPFRG